MKLFKSDLKDWYFKDMRFQMNAVHFKTTFDLSMNPEKKIHKKILSHTTSEY